MPNNLVQNDIQVYRGDDWGMQLTFAEPDGTPVDITGWTIFLTLKRKKTDSDADAVIQKVVTAFSDPVGGIAYVILTNEETHNFNGLYYYDFQYKDQNDMVQTITSGGLTFVVDITRRTS